MRRRGLLDMGLPSAGLLGQVIGPRPMPVQQGRAPSVIGAPAMRGGGSVGQGLASLGQSLSGIAEMRQRQEVLDMQKQRMQQEAQQAALQQQQADSQQQARATLYGGMDPTTGISWNTGRQGMDPAQERALMARGYPQAAQAAAAAALTPKEAPKAERFEVKQGDRIKTFVGVPGDPNTWQEVATAPRSEAKPETYKLFSPRGDKEQTVEVGSMTDRELKKLGWSPMPAAAAPDARQTKISDIMRLQGLDLATATGIVDGYISARTDPVTGNTALVNTASGQGRLVPIQMPPIGSNDPAPSGTQQRAQQQEQRPVLEAITSLGATPWIKEAGSKTFGQWFEAANDPAVTQDRQQVRLLRENLLSAFARSDRPSNYAQQRVEELMPSMGVWESPSRAYDMLATTSQALYQQVAEDMALYNDPTLPAKQRQEARKRVTDANRALRMIGNPADFERPQATTAPGMLGRALGGVGDFFGVGGASQPQQPAAPAQGGWSIQRIE